MTAVVPYLLVDQAGLCCWHQEDNRYAVPKVRRACNTYNTQPATFAPCAACACITLPAFARHPNQVDLAQLGGLCQWCSFRQVHVKLHLVTHATYETPEAAVASRLLLRVLQELLLPDTYHASLAGSSFHLLTEQTGLQLTLVGFTEVVPELLRRVLSAMRGVRRARWVCVGVVGHQHSTMRPTGLEPVAACAHAA
jgi:secreted Zn-dependent insulinase-like peptidase